MITTGRIRKALQCDNTSCACHKPTGHVHCPAHDPAPEHGDRCDCIHPASTQAAMVVSSSPPTPDEKALSTAPNHTAPPSDVLPDIFARAAAQVRNHAPPPVYLLDCAFLI